MEYSNKIVKTLEDLEQVDMKLVDSYTKTLTDINDKYNNLLKINEEKSDKLHEELRKLRDEKEKLSDDSSDKRYTYIEKNKESKKESLLNNVRENLNYAKNVIEKYFSLSLSKLYVKLQEHDYLGYANSEYFGEFENGTKIKFIVNCNHNNVRTIDISKINGYNVYEYSHTIKSLDKLSEDNYPIMLKELENNKDSKECKRFRLMKRLINTSKTDLEKMELNCANEKAIETTYPIDKCIKVRNNSYAYVKKNEYNDIYILTFSIVFGIDDNDNLTTSVKSLDSSYYESITKVVNSIKNTYLSESDKNGIERIRLEVKSKLL